jgi:hypothetical protein
LPDDKLDFKPHEKTNTIRTILVHQLLSERRFFAQFVGTGEPPVEELLPAGEKPGVSDYIEKYVWLTKPGCRSSHRARPCGDWRADRSSAGLYASASGCSGGGCCTPATIEHRYRVGCAWPGATSRPSTGRRAT